jgi:hypothetical protein
MPIDVTKAVQLLGFNVYDVSVEEVPYSIKGAQAVWNIVCNWNERLPLANALAGLPPFPGANAPPIKRYPNMTGLITSDIRIVGDEKQRSVDSNTGIVAYDLAKMTITFQPPVTGGVFGGGSNPDVIEVDFLADAIRLPGESFTFPGGDKVDNEAAPVQIVPTTDWIIPRSGSATLNETYYQGFQGTVNAAQFRGAAAETVMFLGLKARQRWVTTINNVYDKVLHFKVRPPWITWNQAWNRAAGAWQTVSPKPYPTGDLSGVLTA